MNTSTVHCTCSAAGPHVIGAMNMKLKLPPSVPVYKPTNYFIMSLIFPKALQELYLKFWVFCDLVGCD
jgi:hypothetical protein